jgi:hypothetical protein
MTTKGITRERLISVTTVDMVTISYVQKIFSSITAQMGKQLKQSVKVFHSLT